jgi:hypothetical protein
MAADLDPEAVAHQLFSLIPGFVVQHLVLGPEDLDTYAAGARLLAGDAAARPSEGISWLRTGRPAAGPAT